MNSSIRKSNGSVPADAAALPFLHKLFKRIVCSVSIDEYRFVLYHGKSMPKSIKETYQSPRFLWDHKNRYKII